MTSREADALLALDRAAYEDSEGWASAEPVADELGITVGWAEQRLNSFVVHGLVERHPADRHLFGLTDRGAAAVLRLSEGDA